MGIVIFSITALAWKYSAEHEHRDRMPAQDRFYPSR